MIVGVNVMVGVLVWVGVFVIVGVLDGVSVIVGEGVNVNVCVGVTVGVNVRVGVNSTNIDADVIPHNDNRKRGMIDETPKETQANNRVGIGTLDSDKFCFRNPIRVISLYGWICVSRSRVIFWFEINCSFAISSP